MFSHSHWIDCGREQELPSCGSSPGQLLSSAGSPPGSPPPPDSSPAISVIIFRKHAAVAEWCKGKVKDIRQDWRYGRFPILPLLESYSRKEKGTLTTTHWYSEIDFDLDWQLGQITLKGNRCYFDTTTLCRPSMLIFLTYLLIHPTLLEQTNGMYLKKSMMKKWQWSKQIWHLFPLNKVPLWSLLPAKSVPF